MNIYGEKTILVYGDCLWKVCGDLIEQNNVNKKGDFLSRVGVGTQNGWHHLLLADERGLHVTENEQSWRIYNLRSLDRVALHYAVMEESRSA